MKKFISILAIFSIAMSFCFQTVSAAIVSGVMTETNVVSSVLTVSLSEYLARATDDDVVQVTIELKDDIDLNDVEEKAISRANISSTEMAALNVNTFSLGEEDNESLQLVTLKVFDRVSRERNSILKNHYSTKNENFILSAGLQDKKIESVGLFTPFIRGVSLTKAQILEVAKNPMVCLIDYVEGQYAIDCDNINNTYKIVGGDTFTNAGYSGSGIRVGLVEQYHPITTKMGSDGDGIVNAINAANSISNVSVQETYYTLYGDKTFDFYPLTTGTKTIAIAWLKGNTGSGSDHKTIYNGTFVNYDIIVKDINGTKVYSSEETNNSVEMVRFYASTTNKYTVEIKRKGTGSSVKLSLAHVRD